MVLVSGWAVLDVGDCVCRACRIVGDFNLGVDYPSPLEVFGWGCAYGLLILLSRHYCVCGMRLPSLRGCVRGLDLVWRALGLLGFWQTWAEWD